MSERGCKVISCFAELSFSFLWRLEAETLLGFNLKLHLNCFTCCTQTVSIPSERLVFLSIEDLVNGIRFNVSEYKYVMFTTAFVNILETC